MRLTEAGIRYFAPAVIIFAVSALSQKASAQSFSVFCVNDNNSQLLVLSRQDNSSSEFLKGMTEGGGIATTGVKSWALSNTVTQEEALIILRKLRPAFATEEAAALLVLVMRSNLFKAGSLGALAYGTYLVFEGFNTGSKTKEQIKKELERDLSSLSATKPSPCVPSSIHPLTPETSRTPAPSLLPKTITSPSDLELTRIYRNHLNSPLLKSLATPAPSQDLVRAHHLDPLKPIEAKTITTSAPDTELVKAYDNLLKSPWSKTFAAPPPNQDVGSAHDIDPPKAITTPAPEAPLPMRAEPNVKGKAPVTFDCDVICEALIESRLRKIEPFVGPPRGQ